MPSLSALLPGSRTQRLRLAALSRGLVGGLRAVRHPNALLASLVILPVLVSGMAFGERTAEARASAGESFAALAAEAGFAVETITIEGLRDTREGDVLDYLAVTPTTSVIGFDIDAARERLLALPWVREASVRRVYPGTLFVDIEEHAPFARMLQRGRIHLVTVEGEEITDEITDTHAALPLVVGEGAPREATAFFAQLAGRPHVLENVVALERVGDRRWTLHMREDVQVHLPEHGVEEALARLETMMRRDAVLERAVAAIDLRLPGQLVLQLTERGTQALSEEAEGLTARRGGA